MRSIPRSLEERFDFFEKFESSSENYNARKNAIRGVAVEVREGSLALSDDQLGACRHDERALARITAYLFVEEDRWKAELEICSEFVRDEWERLQSQYLAPGSTAMPLHYSLKAYRHHVLRVGETSAAVDLDLKFLQTIQARLLESSLDSGGQVRDILSEIIGSLVNLQKPVEVELTDDSRPSVPNKKGPSRSVEPSRNWVTPANVLALLGLMTAPGLLSFYQSNSAVKTVNKAYLIVATGVHEFRPDSAWTESEAVKDWRETKARIRFDQPVPCDRPDVRVSLSSFDLGTATRLDIAAPDAERTRDGFLLVARTWGGATEIHWVKVDWFAACQTAKTSAQ